MLDPRRILGFTGESLAEKFLKRRGFKCLTRNFFCPTGEIDLIMRDGDTIVFVEVKTLTHTKLSEAVDQLRPAQQRKLIKTANVWRQQKRVEERPCRFDVIGIELQSDGREPLITYIEDAFGPSNGW